jgi:3-dehydroquinate synthase
LEKITINTPQAKSDILVGEGWESVSRMLPEQGVVIVTDDNIRNIYGDRFPDVPVFSVRPGEESKKLSVIEELSSKLLDAGVDRNGFILAIGGGVVSDLAGFLASVYLRGIRCGYISSSLLSQVDASTGGKNGVNLGGTKNILGVIRQPEFVICDTGMLQTLSEEEFLSGLSEMIKTAIIGDSHLFDMIESNYHGIMKRENDLMKELVFRSVRFKAAVVTEDENEKGLRRILNFGHTFGHAIEMKTGFMHGFAVASGMELATLYSLEKGMISIGEKDRILALLTRFGLLRSYDIDPDEIGQLVMHDKKKSGNAIHFVFADGIGKAVSEKIPVTEVIGFYNRFRDKKQAI